MPGRSLTFLIMNSAQYWSFEHTTCFYSPPTSLMQVYAPAFTGSWTVPQTGEYAFVFLSYPFYGGQVNLQAREYAPFTQSGTVTYTSTSILENTNTIFSTLAPTPTQTGPGSGYTLPLWLPIVLVAAAAAGLVLVLRKHRS
jgi:hypothetical protein